MRTVKHYLEVADSGLLCREYFRLYGPNLFDLARDDHSLKDVITEAEKKLERYIKELLKLEPKCVNEEDECILYAYQRITSIGAGVVFEMVFEKDVLKGVEYVPARCFRLSELEAVMGFFVAETDLTQDYIYPLLAYVLHEMSFFGYPLNAVPYPKKELRSLEEERYCEDEDDLFVRREYKDYECAEAKELRRAGEDAAERYRDFCRQEELEKVRVSI